MHRTPECAQIISWSGIAAPCLSLAVTTFRMQREVGPISWSHAFPEMRASAWQSPTRQINLGPQSGVALQENRSHSSFLCCTHPAPKSDSAARHTSETPPVLMASRSAVFGRGPAVEPWIHRSIPLTEARLYRDMRRSRARHSASARPYRLSVHNCCGGPG